MRETLTKEVKMAIEEKTLKENLHLVTDNKETLDQYYQYILDNTEKKFIPLKAILLETSNVFIEDEENKQSSIEDLLLEEELEEFRAGFEYANNYEHPNTTFLSDNEFAPSENISNDIINHFNTTTNLWAMMPKDNEEALKAFMKYNYLTKEDAMKELKSIGYTLTPMTYNAVKDIVKKKMGDGRPLHSLYGIGNGKLKRELATQSVMFSGKNADNNKDGFFKTIFNAHFAYLSNYTDLFADDATKVLEKVYLKDYSDFSFTRGELTPYSYTAVYESKMLGEKLANETSIEYSSAKAKIYFNTSDLGLSSINVRAYLEMDILAASGIYKTIKFMLSDMVSLNHNAIKVDLEAWKEKCEEVTSLTQVTIDALVLSEKIELNLPLQVLENIMEDVGMPESFEGKDSIIEDFKFYLVLSDGKMVARDVFVTLNELLNKWSLTNEAASIKGMERLARILTKNTWSKYDIVK